MAIRELFGKELKIINIGLRGFKEDLGSRAVHVDWKPPLELAPGAWEKIRSHRSVIEAANVKAIEAVLTAEPRLTDLRRALDVVPGMEKDLILHAGPPISWERMCGPMKGAVIGALLYEGKASRPEEAEKLAASGSIRFSPCHEHGAVGPMAGIISASMPVFVVQNAASENFSYATLNEGLGKVLRYGAYGEEVIRRLKWMEAVLFPVLQGAVRHLGGVDLKSIIAQALHMGDEVHNRNRAATSLLFRALAPAIVRTCKDTGAAASVLDFIQGNDHFFLNLSMAASKAMLDVARDIPCSSLCVAMARNGVDFGVQVSGTGGAWFTGPAPVPDALFFKGFTKADANPDIGDSSITETTGLGGFAIAASPAIVQFVGGSVADALATTLQMYEISLAESRAFQIASLGFRGSPTGIDVLKIAEKRITPFIDTGVAHRNPGIGQVGAGVLSAPMEPFEKAVNAFAEGLS